jgi:hypothetical protein
MTVNNDLQHAPSDDVLMADLRRIAAAVDGPPADVLAAARAAFLTRDLDGELALLVADTRTAEGEAAYEPVRADATPAQGSWLLSFEGGGVQVDMEVDEEHGRIRLIGQFSGASGDEYYLESEGERRPIEVDDLGRFIVDDVRHGPVRLRCRSADGAPVTTVWVTI